MTTATGPHVIGADSLDGSYRLVTDKGLAPVGLGLGELLVSTLAAMVKTRSGSSEVRTLSEGERNDGLISLGGTMIAAGLSDEAVTLALLEHNRAACHPPLEEAEVLAVVTSAIGYRRSDG